MTVLIKLFLLLLTSMLVANTAVADEIRLATASNFRAAMTELAVLFEAHSGHRVVVISGSTGKHFAQIVNGAPYHAFFAADKERPGLLDERGIAVANSRFTYAVGSLALWSHESGLRFSDSSILEQVPFRHLALANPGLAPYGRAARETLESLGLWDQLQDRLVLGENASQAFQFVHSGNATLGLVAWPQVLRSGGNGSYWRVPPGLHQPIEQQAVLLVDEQPAREFMAWMRSPNALNVIRQYGYGQP